MTTFEAGIIVQHPTVKRSHILHLNCDRPVTIGTTIRQSGALPRRGVTGLAISAGPRVRSDAAQHWSTLRIQRTGVV